ncbi:CynX/NimT family MFS transporter [Hansschlegelia plantiphila]|uniref:MFS transporter n=1 Tax=Hansschlegelia plantiphila TaxID=374655 RepID=A0A9W6J0D3_9HYPH|nr:MFS transporter [Hansschlegelia plantiphila]GLK66989.1 MFS transporter [Hansschlegelia plantiphila]
MLDEQVDAAADRPRTVFDAPSATLAIVGVVLVALSLRPGIVSTGPLLPAVSAEFGLSHAAAALLVAIPDLLMGLLALPTPWLARRFGRDRVILGALALLCASIVIRAFAAGPFTLLGATIGVGAGIAVVGALIAGFVKARFPAKAAMMMGIYATALSLGSTLAAAATGPVAAASASGWRLASGMWGVLGVVAILAWSVVVASERGMGEVKVAGEPRTALPLGDPKAWLVALFFACDNWLFYAILSWTSPIHQELGYSATTAGLILASFTAVFMCSNPVFGWLSRSEDRRPFLALCGLLSLAGLLPLAIWPGAAPFLFVPICAVGLGGGFTLGMTLPLDNTRTVDEANVWNAFVLTVGYLVATTGPLLVGAIRDVAGDFRPAIFLMAAVAAAMLALTPALGPRRRPR